MRLAVAISTVFLAAASAAHAAPFKLQPDSPRVVTAKDRVACGVQTQLPWCEGRVFQRVSDQTWTIEKVAALQASLTAKFLYSYDPDAPWRSHLDVAGSGAAWADDCDGLTFTVLDALAAQGFPAEKIYRAVVNPEGNASMVAHMVGIVEVEGIYLVVGDTNYSAPYPLAKARFKPVLLSQASAGKHWLRAALNARPLARPIAE